MTSRARDWHGNRRAVFDRDDHTCRRCGATDSSAGDADAGDETAPDSDPDSDLRLYPVGDILLEGEIHESSLVTVCPECFAGLQAAPNPDESVRLSDDDLFALAREMTQRQGVTVSAVAEFASLATSLPTDLEAAGDDADAKADAEADYLQARREVLLAIDSVPSRLERLAAVDSTTSDPAVADSLASIVDAGRRLQSALEEIVVLCETVAAGLDRCQGCLEPYAAANADADNGDGDATDTCPTCRLERRDVSDWRQVAGPNASDEDAVSFGHLFTAINDVLQDASETTEELTESAATLAEALQGEGDAAA